LGTGVRNPSSEALHFLDVSLRGFGDLHIAVEGSIESHKPNMETSVAEGRDSYKADYAKLRLTAQDETFAGSIVKLPFEPNSAVATLTPRPF
jgi:hypothetical protein